MCGDSLLRKNTISPDNPAYKKKIITFLKSYYNTDFCNMYLLLLNLSK